MPVFRAVATVVAAAMLSISGSAALQHVHAYADPDHDHADHHHGPAVHAHSTAVHADDMDSHAPDDAARIEGCDPGRHAVAVVFTCVAPQHDAAPVPITLETFIAIQPEQEWRPVVPSEVRAHSPPRLTDAPLRAPPVIHLA